MGIFGVRRTELSVTSRLKTFKSTKVTNSIKTKFLLVFAVIILLMLMINLASSFITRSSVGKLDDMIQATIAINSIISETKNITVGKDTSTNVAYLNGYNNTAAFESKKEESLKYKKMITESLSSITASLERLEKDHLADEKSKQTLDTTRNVLKAFQTSLEQVFQMYEKKDLKAAISGRDRALRNGQLLIDSMQNLLSDLLNYEQVEKEKVNKQLELTSMSILAAIILVGVISAVTAFVFTGRIAGTITRLSKTSQSIAEGNLLVESVQVVSGDEISVLAKSFNSMTENLRALIKKISDSGDNVLHCSEVLKLGSEQNMAAIQQISANVQLVAEGASDQSQKSRRIVEVVNHLAEGNKKVYDNAQGVLAVSNSANNAAEIGTGKMENLSRQISTVEYKILETQGTTEKLKVNVGQIRKILDSINQIASQTNLLALNAAIEAARAGENGRGFSVVAEEISKLAKASADATMEIAGIINAIQAQTESVSQSMAVGVGEVKEGSQMVREAKLSFGDIREINIQVEEQVRNINEELRSMIMEIRKVEEMSMSISDSAGQFAAGNQEVAASVEEQTASMEEILSSSMELSRLAEELHTATEKFKI